MKTLSTSMSLNPETLRELVPQQLADGRKMSNTTWTCSECGSCGSTWSCTMCGACSLGPTCNTQ